MTHMSLSAILATAALSLSLLSAGAQAEDTPVTPSQASEPQIAESAKAAPKPECHADKKPSVQGAKAAVAGSLLNKALESWGRKNGIDGLGQMAGRGVQSTIDKCSSLPKAPVAQP